jgi:hypothetical protein
LSKFGPICLSASSHKGKNRCDLLIFLYSFFLFSPHPFPSFGGIKGGQKKEPFS